MPVGWVRPLKTILNGLNMRSMLTYCFPRKIFTYIFTKLYQCVCWVYMRCNSVNCTKNCNETKTKHAKLWTKLSEKKIYRTRAAKKKILPFFCIRSINLLICSWSTMILAYYVDIQIHIFKCKKVLIWVVSMLSAHDWYTFLSVLSAVLCARAI